MDPTGIGASVTQNQQQTKKAKQNKQPAKKLKKISLEKFTEEKMCQQFVDHILSIPGLAMTEEDMEWLEELEKIEII